jgi:hypothetical protein
MAPKAQATKEQNTKLDFTKTLKFVYQKVILTE